MDTKKPKRKKKNQVVGGSVICLQPQAHEDASVLYILLPQTDRIRRFDEMGRPSTHTHPGRTSAQRRDPRRRKGKPPAGTFGLFQVRASPIQQGTSRCRRAGARPARYNRPGFDVIANSSFYLWAGQRRRLNRSVAAEAASLAGHLKLGELIYLYDDNHITLGGCDAADLHRRPCHVRLAQSSAVRAE